MPPKRTVELRVGGQVYRVVATDNEAQLERLSAIVGRKHDELMPQGRGSLTVQQAMMMTAMAIAEELEVERQKAQSAALEAEKARTQVVRMREVTEKLLARVDLALTGIDASEQGVSARKADESAGTDEALSGPDTTPDPGPAAEEEDPDGGSGVKLEGLFAISTAGKGKSAPVHRALGQGDGTRRAPEKRGAKAGSGPTRLYPFGTTPEGGKTAPAARGAGAVRSKHGLWVLPGGGKSGQGPFATTSKLGAGRKDDDDGDD